MATFQKRHLGLSEKDTAEMLESLEMKSWEQFIELVVPQSIRLQDELTDPQPVSETEVLASLAEIAGKNRPGKC